VTTPRTPREASSDVKSTLLLPDTEGERDALRRQHCLRDHISRPETNVVEPVTHRRILCCHTSKRKQRAKPSVYIDSSLNLNNVRLQASVALPPTTIKASARTPKQEEMWDGKAEIDKSRIEARSMWKVMAKMHLQHVAGVLLAVLGLLSCFLRGCL
jgi:hypothetical protein